jgi:hypothetical protein
MQDYLHRAVATLFGRVTLRLPRFRCAGCGGNQTGHAWPSHCRSTPEPDRLQAYLSALMPCRVAADFLQQMFPVDAGRDVETLRRHALKISDVLRKDAVAEPETPAQAVTVTLDSSFIRNCAVDERYLEVRAGNVETEAGGRRVFAAVARSDTEIAALIRRSLYALGRTGDTALTAFTGGCSGLRRILADAGSTEAPMPGWFHIAMRLRHPEQTAGGVSADDPGRAAAKAVIVPEIERLRWRLWNGKATDARTSMDRIRAVMHHFRSDKAGERRPRPQGNYAAPCTSRLSHRTARSVGQLRQAARGRIAGWHGAHRSGGQFSGEPSDEQIAADALVATRGGSSAAGSLRCL